MALRGHADATGLEGNMPTQSRGHGTRQPAGPSDLLPDVRLGAMPTALRGHANATGLEATCPRKAVGMAPGRLHGGRARRSRG